MGRLAVAVIVATWAIPISILVNRVVPDPYMDEIFHVPQARRYCEGNFKSWDPMITTPPGLYCFSLAHVALLYPWMFVLRWASTFSNSCSATILRSFNGVLAVVCSILVYDIIVHLRPTLDRRKATFLAVVLVLYPLHWFFTFLYYTDVASLTLFLAMYLASLRKKYWFSALLGALSVFIRQTNIIWMIFVACTSIIDMTFGQQTDRTTVDNFDVTNRENSGRPPEDNIAAAPGIRNRKMKNTQSTLRRHSMKASISRVPGVGLIDEVQTIIFRSWHMKQQLLILFTPFLLVLAAFIAFVRWNGSIVLGAKEAHAVSLHFAQLLYLGLISALASAPIHFTLHRAAVLLSKLCNSRLFTIFLVFVALAAGFLSVHFFSIAHPYLLADNRHYTFYLWRKVINAHWTAKYLLVPLYIYSWASIFETLGKTQKKIWLVVYFFACAAALVPAPLIEFRYYTIPFFILMLHSPVTDSSKFLLMGFAFIIVNVFTMSMFMFRPFKWDHEPGTQRFIW